jgi:Rod binding domain-containing protein
MIAIAGSTAAATASAGASQSSSSVAPSPKLVHAAREFEAQMMKELLKPMTTGDGLDGEDSDAATGAGGALGAFASEVLGQGLSEQGGFGIASSIIRQLAPAGNKQVTGAVTTIQHGNTVLKIHE